MPTACTCDRDAGFTPQVDCSSKRAAAAALRVLAALPTCNANALEVFEPGSGLITVNLNRTRLCAGGSAGGGEFGGGDKRGGQECAAE